MNMTLTKQKFILMMIPKIFIIFGSEKMNVYATLRTR